MLKQGATEDVRLLPPKAQVVEEQRLAAAGRVVSGQQVARELGLRNISLVDVR
jgi:biotin operon repressor